MLQWVAGEEEVIWSCLGKMSSASTGPAQTVANCHIVCLMLFFFKKNKDLLFLKRTGNQPDKCEFKAYLGGKIFFAIWLLVVYMKRGTGFHNQNRCRSHPRVGPGGPYGSGLVYQLIGCGDILGGPGRRTRVGWAGV